MKDRTKEQQPSTVPETAQQGGEIRARWAWVEPAVWTERMLATLETGIEGGKWFRLLLGRIVTVDFQVSIWFLTLFGGLAGLYELLSHLGWGKAILQRLGFSA